ncbi:MAG: hypothetical protein ACRELY_16005 [Polyangiaceae bacterium]
MLREERAVRVTYDAAKDRLTVTTAVEKSAINTPKSLNLLLDARDHLVGIDIDADSPARAIVMLGRHEDVAAQRPARGEVAFDSAGAPAIVTIHDARGAVRVDERNPYV